MFERGKNGNKTIIQTEWTWFLCELILYDYPTTKNIIKNSPLIFSRKTNNKSIILNAHFNDKAKQKKLCTLFVRSHSLIVHCASNIKINVPNDNGREEEEEAEGQFHSG